MKLLSSYDINFYGREREKESIYKYLISKSNCNLFVHGKSGVGKTELVYQVLKKYHNHNENAPIIYFDALLGYNTADYSVFAEYFAIMRLFTSSVFNRSDMSNLPEHLSLSSYITDKNISNSLKSFVLKTMKVAIGFMPHGTTVKALANNLSTFTSNNENLSENYSFIDFLSSYFMFVKETESIVVIIDNIQELKEYELSVLKKLFQKDANIIQIYREKENEVLINTDIIKFIVSAVKSLEIMAISRFSHNDVIEIMNENINDFKLFESEYKEKLTRDCFESTNGCINDIKRYILNFNQQKSTHYIPTIQDQTLNFGLISKQVVFILSQFKTGIKKNMIIDIFKDYLTTDTSIEETLLDLLEDGLIDLGKYNDGIVAPSHENIIRTSESLLENDNNEVVLDIIPHINNTLIKKANEENSEFLFLVKSILSFNKLSYLKKEIYLIIRYLKLLYEYNLFTEITNFYKQNIINDEENNIMFELFPIEITNVILDSLQKTGEFEIGLKLTNLLSNSNMISTYSAKYLSQLYRYDEAIEILNRNIDSFENRVLLINIYQHLRKDKKVKKLIEDISKKDHGNVNYLLLLRNSGHLYEIKTSIENLTKCINYFEKNSFYQGTAYNNLAIQLIRNTDYHKALNVLEKAQDIFTNLSSNEIYQVYFNKSVYYTMLLEENKAMSFLKKGFKTLPKSLKFDIYKFMCNLFFINYLEDGNCRLLLNRLMSQFKKIKTSGIPDKWLYFQYSKNIINISAFIGIEINPEFHNTVDDFEKESVDYGQKIITNDFEYILAISPHWRF